MSSDELIRLIEETARVWNGVAMPHPTARAFAADLGGVIAAFERLPPVDFDARYCDFAPALAELADRD